MLNQNFTKDIILRLYRPFSQMNTRSHWISSVPTLLHNAQVNFSTPNHHISMKVPASIASQSYRQLQNSHRYFTSVASFSTASTTTTVSDADGKKEVVRDPRAGRDPSKVVSIETSMRYLKSDAYKETYGDNRVWVLYRRNFKGQFAPKKTRKSCMIQGKIDTGNPCPICRDEYLVIDYRNVDLLKQFISPHNGETLGTDKTGVCQEQHFKLLAAIDKAKDYGNITFDVKFREYNYEEYYPKEVLENLSKNGHKC